MMMHMVRVHPEECTAEEREQYRDKQLDKMNCERCGKLVSVRNIKEHMETARCKGHSA